VVVLVAAARSVRAADREQAPGAVVLEPSPRPGRVAQARQARVAIVLAGARPAGREPFLDELAAVVVRELHQHSVPVVDGAEPAFAVVAVPFDRRGATGHMPEVLLAHEGARVDAQALLAGGVSLPEELPVEVEAPLEDHRAVLGLPHHAIEIVP